MTIDARSLPRPPAKGLARNAPLNPGWGLALLVATTLGTIAYTAHVFAAAQPDPPAPSAAVVGRSQTMAAQIASDDSKFVRLIGVAREQLGGVLKDPDSAKYKDVMAVSHPKSGGAVTFCGLVNAKNSFGGFTGYQRFIVAPNVGAWTQRSRGIHFNGVWREICQDRYIVRAAAGF